RHSWQTCPTWVVSAPARVPRQAPTSETTGWSRSRVPTWAPWEPRPSATDASLEGAGHKKRASTRLGWRSRSCWRGQVACRAPNAPVTSLHNTCAPHTAVSMIRLIRIHQRATLGADGTREQALVRAMGNLGGGGRAQRSLRGELGRL